MVSDRKPSVENKRASFPAASTHGWGLVPDANWLVAWLNDPAMVFGAFRPKGKSRFVQQEIAAAKRIETLIERLKELSRVIATLETLELPKHYPHECYDAVKEITDQYRIAPGFGPHHGRLEVFDSWVGYYLSTSEYLAFMAIRELVRNTSLGRIRRCAQCQLRWIVCWRKDRQFCSGKCRQAHYDASPEGKASRRRANRRSYLKRISSIRKDRRRKKRAKS